MSTQGNEPNNAAVSLLPVRNGPGMRLRAGREALHLNVEEVAKHLRLTPRLIEAIEQDHYSDDVPLVFTKGYIRAYAKLLDMDETPLIEEFNRLGLSEPKSNLSGVGQGASGDKIHRFNPAPHTMAQGKTSFRWVIMLGVLGIVAAAVWTYKDQLPVLSQSNLPIEEVTETQALDPLSDVQSSPSAAATAPSSSTSDVQTIFVDPETSTLNTPDQMKGNRSDAPQVKPQSAVESPSISTVVSEAAKSQEFATPALSEPVPEVSKLEATKPAAKARKSATVAHETLLF